MSRITVLSVSALVVLGAVLPGCAGSVASLPEASEHIPTDIGESAGEVSESLPEEPFVTIPEEPLRVRPADGDTEFPPTNAPIVVRTDFSNDEAWAEVVDQARTEIVEGLDADFSFINDRDFEGMTAAQLLAIHPVPTDLDSPIFAIADSVTAKSENRSLLVVDLYREHSDELRTVPGELGMIEANLSISNVDWEEFVANSEDGVHVG